VTQPASIPATGTPVSNGAVDTPRPAGPIALANDHQLAAGGDTAERSISAFSSVNSFEAAQRMAKSLAASTLVPKDYQNNLSNCLIAIELSSRTGASVLMVMQNLYIVHGRPGWGAQFLIGTANTSGRFTPLRFEWQGTKGKADWGCRAVAKDRRTGEELTGAWITWDMVKAEGWSEKSGSKWKTMPEQMFMYRAGTFWTRVYAPEIGLGMATREEIIDTTGTDVTELPNAMVPGSPKALEQALMGTPAAPAAPLNVTADGEVLPAGAPNPNPAAAAAATPTAAAKPEPTEAEKLAAEAAADEAAHAKK
jgi:hypothetical protein